MAQGLSLSTSIRILSCPSCKETINDSMLQCPFCFVAVDPDTVASAVDALTKLNQACSDASYLRIMVSTAATFFCLQIVPFISMLARFGFLFLELAVPAMSIRWWIKFMAIQTEDPEFARARSSAKIIAIGSILFLVVDVAVRVAFVRVHR
jgi:hypothetical protein